jgi:predicted  nucleic acid-binding Zn-ribbon protein
VRPAELAHEEILMSTSPNVPEPEDRRVYEVAGAPRWIFAGFIVFIAAFALIGYLLYANHAARTNLASDLAQANSKQAVLATQIDQANGRLAELNGQQEITAEKLGLTQTDLEKARSLAQGIRHSQQESDAKLTAQIGQVDTKIGEVSTDLNGAKGDITATKQDLESTKANLTSTIGDLGVQSGLIARNQEDLEQLKRQGERRIFEIHLTKSKTSTHVGPIQLTLTKTDPKKSKYTMTVLADDKTIEKKDKTAEEPVQFYVKGTPHPYEIVIFDVTKDNVNGYLSLPKDTGPIARAQ